MKPHPSSLLLAAALAGCSSVPFELNDGPTANYTSTQAPRDVVNCIVRNQAKNGFTLTPALEERDKGEMTFWLRASDGDIHFQAQLKPVGMGSAAIVRTISIPVRDRLEAALMAGC